MPFNAYVDITFIRWEILGIGRLISEAIYLMLRLHHLVWKRWTFYLSSHRGWSFLFQAVQLKFSLHRCICEKHKIICIVCIYDSFYRILSASCLFLCEGCDEGHWHTHTRGLPWGLPEVVGTVEQVHCSWRRLL